jgi:hypothetical protein
MLVFGELGPRHRNKRIRAYVFTESVSYTFDFNQSCNMAGVSAKHPQYQLLPKFTQPVLMFVIIGILDFVHRPGLKI